MKTVAASAAIAILLSIPQQGFAGLWPFGKKEDSKKSGEYFDQTCTADSCQPLKVRKVSLLIFATWSSSRSCYLNKS